MFNLCSSTWPKSQLRADWAYLALAVLGEGFNIAVRLLEMHGHQVANEIEYPHEAKPAFLIGNRRVQLQHFIADRGERGGTALSIGHEPVPKINDALIHILSFRPWRRF